MKFRKKPVVIEAFRFEGHGFQKTPKWWQDAINIGEVSTQNGLAKITTLEGVMSANVGDWIIKGVKGEIYPCKPDIFYATYEAADD